ncbi:MAG: hypothetical protein Q8T09_08695 [Candidatus Melainabacteria bacterium]|nr:hypothetical protein [Candidatus Melainabacteria bacterium]
MNLLFGSTVVITGRNYSAELSPPPLSIPLSGMLRYPNTQVDFLETISYSGKLKA